MLARISSIVTSTSGAPVPSPIGALFNTAYETKGTDVNTNIIAKKSAIPAISFSDDSLILTSPEFSLSSARCASSL